MAHKKIEIAVADGDGIGPEIMKATLTILDAVGAPLDYRKIAIGEKLYLSGKKSGIDPSDWETIRSCKAFLKAPITTPQGGGYKSLNVTIRTTMGLYANVRPCVSYYPFIQTKHPKMDVVIVRENEEDLYTGIEYRQTPEVVHALKIISRSGTEKIIRYAFEYAVANERKKVTCFTKDNILKLTDGHFHKVFEEIAAEYPSIEHEHWIVDIGAAKLADTPEAFDVIVLPNLYGDILSDVAAQITGSVGLAGSANIGPHGAMFEAIHGSAPKRAGQNVANPSGLLLAAVMMLVHLDLPTEAGLIHNAWLKTIEDGIHTYDIFKEGVSKTVVGTQEFAQAVIERLGQNPKTLKAVQYTAKPKSLHKPLRANASQKEQLVGVDVFVAWHKDAEGLAKVLQTVQNPEFELSLIGNRGVIVWPNGHPETACVDTWRARFVSKNKTTVTHKQISELLGRLAEKHINFLQTENLLTFDGVPGFSG